MERSFVPARSSGGLPGRPDTTTSLADILERVLEADVEDLAECLSETTRPHADRPGRGVDEVGSAGESPDDAARRRLGARTPGAASTPGTRSINVGR